MRGQAKFEDGTAIFVGEISVVALGQVEFLRGVETHAEVPGRHLAHIDPARLNVSCEGQGRAVKKTVRDLWGHVGAWRSVGKHN